jgi:hypothetical protein
MSAWKVGGYAAAALGVAAAVGVGGAFAEAPMVHGAASQSNGDFFAAGFGTVMGVMLGSAGAIGAGIMASDAARAGHSPVGWGLAAMASIGVAVGSVAARIGASQIEA